MFAIAQLHTPILTTWEWIGLVSLLSGVGVWMGLAYARLSSMDSSLAQVRNDLREHQQEHRAWLAVLGNHERRLSVAENEIEHLGRDGG